ncbi:hypothetical protein PtA15_4A764 [Puccinia triticina]|uniref:Uncharacterized protein n=1 Tax=Puccinia triticina TaxID=208348 RepID=A0ABY7CJK9_9BASI|nr:uncharacterized protein PtA15_4A764 [Puccinia triticina]WAQ84311.1 hypothetical protein PtA15_4A764 [Puccinia triticina]
MQLLQTLHPHPQGQPQTPRLHQRPPLDPLSSYDLLSTQEAARQPPNTPCPHPPPPVPSPLSPAHPSLAPRP